MSRFLLVVEGVVMAVDAMRSNRVRAALTIMGVAVGVFVVVAMGAVVNGIQQSFRQDLESIGATSFFVRRRNPGLSGCDGTDEKCPDRRHPPVSFAEWELIERLPGVQHVVGQLGGGANFAYRSNRADNVGYDAYSPEWPLVDPSDISPGRNFTRSEHEGGQPVVLLNDTLRAQLLGDSEPIGKQVQLNGQPFMVIGIYQSKAGFLKTMEGKGPDRPRAILPLQSAVRRLDLFRRDLSLLVRPSPFVPQSQVMDDVMSALRTRRGLKPGMANTFFLVGQDRLLETFGRLFGAIFAVGLGLSAVALLVGGVGVVAIMTISVTERTREIGVRKALGATAGTIRWQFLVEAATLTSLGAAVGLAIGAGLAWAIRANTPIPASLPPGIVVTALVASAVTGVAFGMVPALRASRLDPVDALRHE